MFRRHRDTDAHADPRANSFAQCVRHRNRADNAMPDGEGLLRRDIVCQHQEFVAAHARDDIGCRHYVAQAFRDHREQLVAGRMPERVVDRLELVEIEEQ